MLRLRLSSLRLWPDASADQRSHTPTIARATHPPVCASGLTCACANEHYRFPERAWFKLLRADIYVSGLAMETFRFLAKTTRAYKLKQSWARATPLELTEGGSLQPLNKETFLTKDTELRDGNKYIGLGCLTDLDNTFSLNDVKFDETQIEGLGRKLWTTNSGAGKDVVPDSPGDQFWDHNHVCFLAHGQINAALQSASVI